MKAIVDELKNRTEKIKLGRCEHMMDHYTLVKFITLCFCFPDFKLESKFRQSG